MEEQQNDKIEMKVVRDFLLKQIMPKVLGGISLIRNGKEIYTENRLRSIYDKLVVFIRKELKYDDNIKDLSNNENNNDR